jgi:S1-C subfamily serine protease
VSICGILAAFGAANNATEELKMRFSLFFVLATLIASVSPAAAWELKAMNATIEQTNVIVSEICSGTVISVEKRLVLTAHHCVAGNLRDVEKREVDPKTGEIKITKVQEAVPMYIETWGRLNYKVVSSEKHEAKLVADDASSDVAILQIDDPTWRPTMAAPLAPDDFEYLRGKVVYAVGNPGIEFDNSVTQGIISAPARRVSFDGALNDIPLFQHSANTIGGNSGGAIYNDDGQIIGTVTGGVRGSDVSLAVPISFTKALLKKLGFGDILK